MQLHALVAELRSQLAEARAAVRTKGSALAEMELRLTAADRQVSNPTSNPTRLRTMEHHVYCAAKVSLSASFSRCSRPLSTLALGALGSWELGAIRHPAGACLMMLLAGTKAPA